MSFNGGASHHVCRVAVPCPAISKNGRRKYRLVSAEGWAMVKKLFPEAADMEYPAGTEPCSLCEEQVSTTIYDFYSVVVNYWFFLFASPFLGCRCRCVRVYASRFF